MFKIPGRNQNPGVIVSTSARAERFELPSTVLETAILPLNYARIYGIGLLITIGEPARKKAKSYPACAGQLLALCSKDIHLCESPQAFITSGSQLPDQHLLYVHLRGSRISDLF